MSKPQNKKLSPKEHRKHVHHTLLYVSAVTAAIVTVVVSVITLDIRTVCVDGNSLNDGDRYGVCQQRKETAYGFPFQQVDGELLWPTALNFALYFALIFGLAKAEAHIKGHIHVKND